MEYEIRSNVIPLSHKGCFVPVGLLEMSDSKPPSVVHGVGGGGSWEQFSRFIKSSKQYKKRWQRLCWELFFPGFEPKVQ